MTKLRINAGPYEFEAQTEEQAPTTLARFVSAPTLPAADHPCALERRRLLDPARRL